MAQKELSENIKKQLVLNWIEVGPLLEMQREKDVRKNDVFGAFSFFAGMVLRELEKCPATAESGLIEQQRWFQKLRDTA